MTNPSDIRIRAMEESDFQKVFDLCEQRFGRGYLECAEFDRWLQYPDFCLVAEYEGEFGGFVCHLPQSAAHVAAFIQMPLTYVQQTAGNKPVILCKAAILVPDFEHHGLMQALVEAVDANSKRLGFGAAFAPAWEYDHFVPMRKTLLGQGYEEIARKENLWYDMEGYDCVICGGRCKCSAVLFQKTF